jgi:alkaline phosphatase D
VKFCLFIALLLSFVSCAHKGIRQTSKLSIIQGQTSLENIELSVLDFKGSGQLEFTLIVNGSESLPPTEVKEVTHKSRPEKIYKVFFDQLKGEHQKLSFIVKKHNKVIDERELTPASEGKFFRLVVVSCMDDSYDELKPIWEEITKVNPDMIFMIGDNVYGDKLGLSVNSADQDQMWRRYVETRSSLPIFFNEKLIPILAIWDDHDAGINNADKTYSHLEKNRQVFEDFFAQRMDSDYIDKGPGLSYLFDKGPYRFFFLDGRSFRDARGGKEHLGADQMDWFFDRLGHDERPALVIKGDQFFGGYHQWDSYEGNHPQEFAEFLERMRKNESPLFLISGDRHLSEIMQFPRYIMNRVTFEITSSPAHGRTYPGSLEKHKSPWHITGYDKTANFTVINSDFVDQFWSLEIANFNAEGRLNYRRELSLFVEDLKNNLNQPDKIRHNRWKNRKRLRRGRR